MTRPASLTACVCTYQRYDILGECLNALLKQSPGNTKYAILVVDNSPNESEAKAFGQKFQGSPIKFLWTATPGLSNARNIGAQKCGTDIIAYIDDDAICDGQWANELLRAYGELGSQCGVVGGRSYPIWQGEKPDWFPNSKLGLLSIVNLGDEIKLIEGKEWLAGVNISFRTSLILEEGGFDTSLGRTGGDATLLSNEETRLVNKLKAKNVQIGYTPHAQVGHCIDPSRLSPTWLRKRVVWQAVSDYLVDASRKEINPTNWPWVSRTIYAAEPRYRNMNFLVRSDCNTEDLEEQLDILYTVTYSSLSGFSDYQEIG
jgi:glycosyltransferase involved in cell wall biosynthesis